MPEQPDVAETVDGDVVDGVVQHVLRSSERGGIHRVQLRAGEEHRFVLHDYPAQPVTPVEILSEDGGAAVFGTWHDEPAVIGGRQCFLIPAVIGAVTLSAAHTTPAVVRLVAEGPVTVSVQRSLS